MLSYLTAKVEDLWYTRLSPSSLLAPLSGLFARITQMRREHYLKPGNQFESPLPVIVVGNLTVGGTGKSPLTAWLVEILQQRGYQPVILTRGYQGEPGRFPLLVTNDTPAGVSGDEPLMLARQCRVPVVVDPDRARAAAWAAAEGLGNILVCDDGLQHYRLARTIELVVFDGQRGAGNGALLPAGPLRESLERLSEVTAVVVNGLPEHATFEQIKVLAPAFHIMALKPRCLRRLSTGESAPVQQFRGDKVHAVAGIGNPGRYFNFLESIGYEVVRHVFPDHHPFVLADFPDDDLPVVMTAKDAVKCEAFAREHWWVLDVVAEPEPGLADRVLNILAART